MTKKTRKILFYSSIFLFLIMSAAIVLFALGYGYDFSKNQILKTGGFGVTANTGVSVYINDRLAGSTSFLSDSYAKSRLLPGFYDVRVGTKDYETWQKQIEIREGAFTDFPAVVLLPSELDIQALKTKTLPTSVHSLYFYKKILYFLSGTQIMSYDTETNKLDILLKKVETFFLDADTLIYRSSDKNFYMYSLSNKKTESLPLPKTGTKNIQKFIIIGNTTYSTAKTGTQSDLFQTRDEQTSKLASNVTGFELSPDGTKLLYFNSHEIHVVYLRDTSYQPYKSAGATGLITRTSRNISNVHWYKDSEHILFSASGLLTFTELDDRGERNSYEIASPVYSFFYGGNDDVIYSYSGSGLTKMGLGND